MAVRAAVVVQHQLQEHLRRRVHLRFLVVRLLHLRDKVVGRRVAPPVALVALHR